MKQQKKILLVTRSWDYTIMFVNPQKCSWRINFYYDMFCRLKDQMEQNWL